MRGGASALGALVCRGADGVDRGCLRFVSPSSRGRGFTIRFFGVGVAVVAVVRVGVTLFGFGPAVAADPEDGDDFAFGLVTTVFFDEGGGVLMDAISGRAFVEKLHITKTLRAREIQDCFTCRVGGPEAKVLSSLRSVGNAEEAEIVHEAGRHTRDLRQP